MIKRSVCLGILITTSVHSASPYMLKEKSQNITSDITFMIADLKYSQNDLKIIEFGSGTEAGFKVLDHTLGLGIIWKKLWRYLNTFDVPIFYIGPREYYSSPKRRAMVAWSVFKRIGGRYARSFKTLEKSKLFRKLQRKFNPDTSPVDFNCIVVVKRKNDIPSFNEHLLFRKKYPHALIVNVASRMYGDDKKYMSRLFNSQFLRKFRPRSKTYARTWNRSIAKSIINDFKGRTRYVIKPINSSCGNGVLIVKKKELRKTLKLILDQLHNKLPFDNTFRFKPYEPMDFMYWKHDRNSHFLVEEYSPSKLIKVNGKKYDATMRIIFVMQHHKRKVVFKPLHAYWKRPIKSVDESGTFREKYISKHAPAENESVGLEVKTKDYKEICRIMNSFMPRVYENILVDFNNASY